MQTSHTTVGVSKRAHSIVHRNEVKSQILCFNALVEKDFEVWKVRKVLKSMERLPIKDILFRWKLPFINAQTQPGSIPKQVSNLLNINHCIKWLMTLKYGLSPTKHPYVLCAKLCIQYCYKMTKCIISTCIMVKIKPVWCNSINVFPPFLHLKQFINYHLRIILAARHLQMQDMDT